MADTIPGNTTSTQTLSIGTSEYSAIDFYGDADWWKVNLAYGSRYQVWVEGYSSGNGTLVDPYLSIYGSTGVYQFSIDDTNIFDAYTYVVPAGTGAFFLSAEESGNNGLGSYKITIWQDELDSTASAATAAVNSASAVGHIGYESDILCKQLKD